MLWLVCNGMVRTGVLQSNTFLKPLLVTSFYGTIQNSVYTTEATTGRSDIRGYNLQVLDFKRVSDAWRCVSTSEQTESAFAILPKLMGDLGLIERQGILTGSLYQHSLLFQDDA